MSYLVKLGRIINSIMKPTGYKIVPADPNSGTSIADKQLIKSLTELSAVYNKYVFLNELKTDDESLAILSNSLYTEFGSGLYLIYYLHQSLHLGGDVCEFGVGQGFISALLAHEIEDTDKNLWLFDSFKGCDRPSHKDILINDFLQLGTAEAYQGGMVFPEDMVRARLSAISFPSGRIRIVPGFISKTIHGPALPKTVCFAYVDFDFYDPILTALQFLDTVLQPGGFVIIDDYDFFSAGAKCAVDEFFDSCAGRYTRTFPEKTGERICILQRKNE
jgi:O-methyltransferase